MAAPQHRHQRGQRENEADGDNSRDQRVVEP